MAKKKSFAEEIAELTRPAPRSEIDPEQDGLEEGAVLEDSDEEILGQVDTGFLSRGKEGRRLRSNIDLGGDEELYIGKHSSRKTFFGDDERVNGDASDSISDDESSHEDDDSDSEEEQEEEEEEEDDGAPLYSTERHAHVDDEADMLEKEIEDVEEAEAQVAEELKDRAAKEYRKALCVKAQKRLWNASLESRIMVQKVVQGAHRLPNQDVHPFIGDADPSLAEEMRAVSIDAERTLDDMCAILDALVEQNTSIQSSKRKRDATGGTIEQVWEALDERYKEIAAFRDTSLDRWHRKTMLSGGSASKSSLKVLNQTVSKQVALVMKDSERIAERSRVPLAQYKGLCQLHPPAVNNNGMKTTVDESHQETGQENEEHTNTLIGVPDTYQDGEFYQALLSEFLEGSTNLLTKNLHKEPKQRKIVDRRASKGRKIRYHIHEKLVNFMTPEQEEVPEYASRIFSNLFGHSHAT
ncbi:hypothetical protein PSENEW3_00006192 [Picochlorum sp. SENEW3]|nr:hypothetical protein PSENEW3_00006192 [Picochlorum sp. SENEW3]